MRDIPLKTDNVGDVLPAGDFNSVQTDLENLVTTSGQTLDPQGGPDVDLFQSAQAAAAYGAGADYYTDGGSANTVVLSRASTLKAPKLLIDGLAVSFYPAALNTGASTINVAGLGVKNLTFPGNVALAPGWLVPDTMTTARYVSAGDRFEIELRPPAARNLFRDGNAVVNGGSAFWQEYTAPLTANGYGADDLFLYNSAGTSHTITQAAFTPGQTDVPGNPRWYPIIAITSSAGAANYSNRQYRIENVSTFAGELVTLSYYAKASAALNVSTELVQNFGTGGSPSSPVTGIAVNKHAVATGWVRYTHTFTLPSISGKTIGTNLNDYLNIHHWFDAGTDYDARTDTLGHQTGTFYLWGLQLERGPVATPFVQRHPALELSEISRYFLRLKGSFPVALGYSGGANVYTGVINTPSAMRTIPAVYGPSAYTLYIAGSGYTVTISSVNSAQSNKITILFAGTFSHTNYSGAVVSTGDMFLDARL